MGRAGQIVVAVLLGTLLPYSLGMGFLDAFPLSVYGLWGMILTRERPWWKAFVEVVMLFAWGLVVVKLRSQTPRFLMPSWTLTLALMAWWAALALLGARFPRVWLPWVFAALLYFLPGEYFVYQYIALGALLVTGASFAARLLRSEV